MVLQRFQMGESTSSALQAQMAVACTLYGEDGSVVSQQIRPLDSPRSISPCRREAAAGELRADAQLVNATAPR